MDIPANKPPTCATCAYVRFLSPYVREEDYICHAPQNIIAKISLITGKSYLYYENCIDARGREINRENCGEAGKWWKPSTVYLHNTSKERGFADVKEIKPARGKVSLADFGE